MTGFSELIPEIQAEVPQCPSLLINRNLSNSLRDFCWHTHYWQHAIDATTLLAFEPFAPSTYIYKLPIPDGSDLLSVIELVVDNKVLRSVTPSWLDESLPGWRDMSGDPNYYLTMSTRQVRIVPASNETKPVALTGLVALQPQRISRVFPDELLEYDQAIIAGALSNLLAMSNKSWADDRRSKTCHMMYLDGVSRAKLEVLTSFSDGPATVAGRMWS